MTGNKAHPCHILGISPGTRTMGLAVLRDGKPIRWDMKKKDEPWSPDKLKTWLSLIESYLTYYNISGVAIKRVHPSRSSSELEKLILAIRDAAKKRSIPLTQYTIEELELFFAPRTRKRNSDHLMYAVAERYPVLMRRYLMTRNNRIDYGKQVFEAVALAVLYRADNGG